ncbi:hypothetical protein PUR71_33160 [Streptomyces sp. SP17BM10]|uniref:hypothetical protein n=1 Tax=Streptomyces sp. SP17BM10 TaxID=3002530 RepID=UPI002E76CE6F|nr:hypothetical protein [Streptomyces sp. SP17BM10]MEE1787721.1 hypothetical protein [Streptomyces sp. SP17BM10]
MSVHVCYSTVDAIEGRVNSYGGAIIIKNSLVRALEGKERLRMARLRQVFYMLGARGLDCYPRVPVVSNEWWSFLVYRRDLLTVDLAAVANDAKITAAVECVLKARSNAPWAHTTPSKVDLRSAVRTLGEKRLAQSA